MVWQAELSSPTVQVRKDLSLVIIRGSWFISGLMIQQALDKGHMFHTLSLTLDTFHNFLNFKVFICKTITKIFSCFMTLIILDMICTLTDLALSSLLICSHYYLHHYPQFLLVGWDICHTGLVKEMNAESGQREKVTHGNRSGSEYSKSHQKELLGYRLECVTQLEPAYKRSLSKSIRDTQGAADIVPTVGTVRQVF